MRGPLEPFNFNLYSGLHGVSDWASTTCDCVFRAQGLELGEKGFGVSGLGLGFGGL